MAEYKSKKELVTPDERGKISLINPLEAVRAQTSNRGTKLIADSVDFLAAKILALTSMVPKVTDTPGSISWDLGTRTVEVLSECAFEYTHYNPSDAAVGTSQITLPLGTYVLEEGETHIQFRLAPGTNQTLDSLVASSTVIRATSESNLQQQFFNLSAPDNEDYLGAQIALSFVPLFRVTGDGNLEILGRVVLRDGQIWKYLDRDTQYVQVHDTDISITADEDFNIYAGIVFEAAVRSAGPATGTLLELTGSLARLTSYDDSGSVVVRATGNNGNVNLDANGASGAINLTASEGFIYESARSYTIISTDGSQTYIVSTDEDEDSTFLISQSFAVASPPDSNGALLNLVGLPEAGTPARINLYNALDTDVEAERAFELLFWGRNSSLDPGMLASVRSENSGAPFTGSLNFAVANAGSLVDVIKITPVGVEFFRPLTIGAVLASDLSAETLNISVQAVMEDVQVLNDLSVSGATELDDLTVLGTTVLGTETWLQDNEGALSAGQGPSLFYYHHNAGSPHMLGHIKIEHSVSGQATFKVSTNGYGGLVDPGIRHSHEEGFAVHAGHGSDSIKTVATLVTARAGYAAGVGARLNLNVSLDHEDFGLCLGAIKAQLQGGPSSKLSFDVYNGITDQEVLELNVDGASISGDLTLSGDVTVSGLRGISANNTDFAWAMVTWNGSSYQYVTNASFGFNTLVPITNAGPGLPVLTLTNSLPYGAGTGAVFGASSLNPTVLAVGSTPTATTVRVNLYDLSALAYANTDFVVTVKSKR